MSEHPLVQFGKEEFEKRKNSREPYAFMEIEEEDKFLNNLEEFPHAFVLACLWIGKLNRKKHGTYRFK